MRKALFLFAVLVCASPAFAQNISVEKMSSFADSLFGRADYYRAITEYERVVFYYPDHPLAKIARYRIALSYFKGEKIDQALSLFRSLSQDHAGEETGRKALFMIGECYYQKAEYLHAKDAFSAFIKAYPDDPAAEEARLKIGWSYLRNGDWRQGANEFQKIAPGSPLRDKAAGLAEGATHYPEIPKKSPALAGGLSAIVPGAGQLYVKRPDDAAVAFLLNGAFIWATAQASHNHNSVTAGILLFFEAGWYLGNIYNAENSAHKYNRQSEQEFMKDLQSRYDLSLVVNPTGKTTFAFIMRF